MAAAAAWASDTEEKLQDEIQFTYKMDALQMFYKRCYFSCDYFSCGFRPAIKAALRVVLFQ